MRQRPVRQELVRQLEEARRELRRLEQAERRSREGISEVGLTAAGLAHETKNPLGIIVGLAHQICHDPAVPEAHALRAEQIIDAAERAASRLGEFIHFARMRDPQPGPTALDPLVRSTLRLLEHEAEVAQVSLRVDVPVARVVADEEMLRQALLNLVLNALQACPSGARIEVRARPSGGRVTLEVVDDGPGVDPQLLPHVFEPYATGRAEGHGLGLAMVRRLVQLHGWSIALASDGGRGTRVTISGIEQA